jgi:hypothetical protein
MRNSEDITAAPSKHYDEAVAPKGGAGKNYQPSRLFDHDQPDEHEGQNDRFYKSSSTKYKHFDFADGSEPTDEKPTPVSPLRPKTTKHGSQWKFEDFSTPDKPKNKVRGQDVRHFGWSDDEGDLKSPVKMPKMDKPRKDAETHFQFVDDGTPPKEKRGVDHAKGAAPRSALGLYQNNVYNEDGSPAKPAASKEPQPLSNVTNAQHRKVFGSHFDIQDESPTSKEKPVDHSDKPISHHQSALKTMTSTWDTYDQSPDQAAKKENIPTRPKNNSGIMANGDGMGGRKGAGRQWGFGDE